MNKRVFPFTKLLLSLLGLMLILSFLFNACDGTTSTTSQTSTTTTTTKTSATATQTSTTTTETQKVLKIGAVIDMRSPAGLQAKKWFDLIAKLKNSQGGWKIGNDTYKVEVITYDSQGDVTKAKDELTRLVLQDGCKFILGQSSTGSAQVDMTITEPNKVITIHQDMTNQVAKDAQYFYISGNFFNSALSYKIAVSMQEQGHKTYCGVRPDNQLGRTMDAAVNTAWEIGAPNVTYTGTVWVAPNTVDYAPIATKVKSLNPDVVDLLYLGLIPNSVPQMYRALYDVGYKGTILPGSVSQAELDALIVQVGKASVEGGVLAPMGLDPRLYVTDPDLLAFYAAYEKEYGKFETDGISDMASWLMLQEGIKQTQSIDTDVLKAYFDNDPPAWYGTTGWVKLLARPETGHYRTITWGIGGPAAIIHDGKLLPSSVTTIKDQYLFTISSMNLTDTYKTYWTTKGYPKLPDEYKPLDTFTYAMLGITGAD